MEFFPVIYSQLSREGLLNYLLHHYEIREPAELHFWLRGMNDTYVLNTEGEKAIFRVYRTDRSQSEIAFELELLQELHRRGVAVSVPIADREGRWIQAFSVPEGIRYGVMFSYAPGEERRISTMEDSWIVGRAAAEIHKASDGFACGHVRGELDFVHLIDKPLNILQSRMAHRREDFEYLCGVIARLREKLEELIREGLDWGICHGDLHGNTNAAFAENGELTHYDFDLCGYGWRAYDIAEFRLAREIHCGDDHEEAECLWQSFMEGYSEVRRLDERDLRAVPLFIGLRQLWLFSLCFSEAELTGCIETDEGFIDSKLDECRSWEARYLVT